MRISKSDSVLLVVDYQEKLAPVIDNIEKVVSKTKILIEGANALEVPVLVTEQYKRGIGETVPEIKSVTENSEYIEKVTFSCLDTPEIAAWLKEQNKHEVILCGIEGHICVLQTLIDLKALGYEVYLVCDAIGSRSAFDLEIGLKRAEQEGGLLTTTEAILFELTRTAKDPNFKTISKLIK